MKSFLSLIGSMVLIVGFMIISGIAHEHDIYRQCVKQGNSGYAGWTVKFNCSPIKQ